MQTNLKRIVEHQTFAVLLATIVLMELAHGIELIALFPLYLHDQMQAGADVIGITLSSYLIADILVRTPAGLAADRWGRKRVLVLGIVLSALPLVLMPQVESATLFLVLNAVNGLGAGCMWPAVYAAIADAYGRERYGVVLGIVNMVMLGGIALGPIFGGLLLSHASYATAFGVCLALVVIALVLVLAGMHAGASVAAGAVRPGRVLATLAAQFNPALVRLLAIGFGLTFALGMMLPLISLFGREVLQVTPEVLSWILVPPGLCTAALIIPAGRWADRYGRHTPMVAGLILIAIPFAGAPASTNPWIVSAGATLAGAGYALFAPAWNALVMEWIPASARGLFLGAVATAQGIGLAVGPLLGGALWQHVGPYAPFEVAAVIMGGAMVLAQWNARRAPATIPGPGDGSAG